MVYSNHLRNNPGNWSYHVYERQLVKFQNMSWTYLSYQFLLPVYSDSMQVSTVAMIQETMLEALPRLWRQSDKAAFAPLAAQWTHQEELHDKSIPQRELQLLAAASSSGLDTNLHWRFLHLGPKVANAITSIFWQKNSAKNLANTLWPF